MQCAHQNELEAPVDDHASKRYPVSIKINFHGLDDASSASPIVCSAAPPTTPVPVSGGSHDTEVCRPLPT